MVQNEHPTGEYVSPTVRHIRITIEKGFALSLDSDNGSYADDAGDNYYDEFN